MTTSDSDASALDPSALDLVYIVDEVGARDWQRLDAALAGGVTAVWLRAPGATGATLFSTGRDLLRRCKDRNAALIMGDRADVAMAVQADFVQLGRRSPPAKFIRPWFRGRIGVSCHSAREIARAHAAGAAFAVLSPIFGVPHKGTPLGVAGFGRLVEEAPLPVVGLGGIDVENVNAVRTTGAIGVAVIRALRDADDPGAVAGRLAGPVRTG